MIQIPDRIKELLHADTCQKNIRIHFPNGERADICNDMIVNNTVSFKESLCSQDSLKFGLCEASVFECEVVNVENITGAKIEVFCEVFCDMDTSGAEFKKDIQAFVYPISYGTFIVETSKRQADVQHRKIVAYGATVRRTIENIEGSEEKYRAILIPEMYYDQKIAYNPYALAVMVDALGISEKLYDDSDYVDVVDGTGAEDLYYLNILNEGTISGNLPPEFGFIIRWYKKDYQDNNLMYFELHGENTKTVKECIEELELPDYYNRYINDYYLGSKIGKSCYAYNYQAPFVTEQMSYHSEQSGLKVGFVGYPVGLYYNKHVFGSKRKDVFFRNYENDKIYTVNLQSSPFKLKYSRSVVGRNYQTQEYQCVVTDKIPWADIFDALTELSGQIGRIDRSNKFEFINAKRNFGLTADEELYPSDSQKPSGPNGGSIDRSDYQTCWYDDDYTVEFGKIKCLYTNTSNEQVIYTYYLVDVEEAENYAEYDISENYFIKNGTFTETQINNICKKIAENINGVSYMGVDYTGRGLPYVEAGDTFEILTGANDSITTIVLQRTLSGEQMLTDKYVSTSK